MNDDGADDDGPDLTPDELAALLAQEPLTTEVFAEPVVGDGIRGDTLLPTAGQQKRGYASDWSPYTGPHGGRGIKNNSTGEIRYGEDVPVDRPKSQDAPTSSRHPAADSSPRATIAELEKTTGGVGAIKALKAAAAEDGAGNAPAPGPSQPSAEAGRRPAQSPGTWASHEAIRSHAKTVAEAHDADPHVRQLHAKLAEADAQVATEAEKYRSDPVNGSAGYQAAVEDKRKVEAAISHESRRTMLLSFGVRGGAFSVADQAELVGHSASDRSKQAKAWKEAQTYLTEISRKGALGKQVVFIEPTRGRAMYDRKKIKTNGTDGPDISAHEFGHHLEEMPWVKEQVAAFRADRYDESKNKPMREVAPNHGYAAHEVGNPDYMMGTFKGDKNLAYYAGKTYAGGRTEIVSMGLELLYRDPVHFMKADPQYFALMVGILQHGPGKPAEGAKS